MLDWNGNGRIDPTDIGISIAVQSAEDAENAETDAGLCGEETEICQNYRAGKQTGFWKWLLRHITG